MSFLNQTDRELETPRLRLRLHRKEDLLPRAALWSNPDVVRHIGGFTRTTEESWNRMVFLIGHWQINGYGYWAIEDKESGRFIGEVGFMDAKRDMELPFPSSFEAGWVLAPPFHKKGLAYEALIGAHDWLKRTINPPSSFCIIHPENLPSIRLAEKLGYDFHSQADYKNTSLSLFLNNRI